MAVVLASGWLTDWLIRQVFPPARRHRHGAASPPRSRRGGARRRLGVAPVRHRFAQVVRPLARPETLGACDHGLRWIGHDGVVLDVPDSAAPAAAVGRPAAGPRGAGAFAHVRTRGRVARGTHAAVAVVVTPCRSDERARVAGPVPHRAPGRRVRRDRAGVRDPRWREREARGL